MEKLMRLEENIKILQAIANELSSHPIDKRIEWEIRYGFFESIQIVIDVACKIAAKYNLGYPKSYKECIQSLIKAKIIDESTGEDFIKMVGFRNVLIHDYEEIDKAALISYLDRLDDFKKFIEAVKEL